MASSCRLGPVATARRSGERNPGRDGRLGIADLLGADDSGPGPEVPARSWSSASESRAPVRLLVRGQRQTQLDDSPMTRTGGGGRARPDTAGWAPMRIDLHAHSAASDGTDQPAEVVRLAAAAGVDVLALTDHDTTAGWPAAVAARPASLSLVRGAEFSTHVVTDDRRRSVHLLGYLFDPDDP